MAGQGGGIGLLMIDAIRPKAHWAASSLGLKKGAWTPDQAGRGWDGLETARCHWGA